jgi:hypothetical protein
MTPYKQTQQMWHKTEPSPLEANSAKYRSKGLKPKMHDLALSVGENKTLNLKDKTSLKLFSRYHAFDIHIKFCVGNSSSITI